MFDPWKEKHRLWKRHSGGIDFMNPRVEQIHIDDLADCLSQECRWSGSVPISVAEHSCLLAEQVPQYYKIYALLHDAAEAYTGDIPSPIKATLLVKHEEMDLIEPFKYLEERILQCIFSALNVPYDEAALEHILNVESEIYDLEIKLYVNRTTRTKYWRSRWKEEVTNAIRLLNG